MDSIKSLKGLKNMLNRVARRSVAGLIVVTASLFSPMGTAQVQPLASRDTTAESFSALSRSRVLELQRDAQNASDPAQRRQLLEEIELIEQEARPAAAPYQSIAKSADRPERIRQKVYFATDRSPTLEEAPYFGSERMAHKISFGEMDAIVSFRIGETRIPADWVVKNSDLSMDKIGVSKPKPLSEEDWKRALVADFSGPPTSALLFVHGFNVSFPEAIVRTAQFKSDMAFPGPVILFSWPSLGEMGLLSYQADKDKVEVSATQLAAVLSSISASGLKKTTVVCHSMGCQILLRAMNELLSKGTDRNHFNRIVLVAPDESWESFAIKFAPLLEKDPSLAVTIYASRWDLAMRVSYLFGGMRIPRLGDPRTLMRLPRRVEYVDASDAASWYRAFGHSYLFDTREVIKDITALVTSGTGASIRIGLARKPNPAGEPGSLIWSFR